MKKQFIRSINIVKCGWKYFNYNEDFGEGLTAFGKHFFKIALGLFSAIYVMIIVILMPLLLMIFKYDAELGF